MSAEHGWLIERRGPFNGALDTYSWWTGVWGTREDLAVWTQDPNACIKFVTKEDAEMVIVGTFHMLVPSTNLMATEHEWSLA
jgi:hypothetical protein